MFNQTYKNKYSKYNKKCNLLMKGMGKVDIAGMIFAHGGYFHGQGLCVVPKNMKIITMIPRTKSLATAGTFQDSDIGSMYEFLKTHEDRKISIQDQASIEYHNIYGAGSIIENLLLDFRVVFPTGSYSLSGIVSKGTIMFQDLYQQLPLNKDDISWIKQSTEPHHDTSIIDTKTLQEQIKLNNAKYPLSDILNRIASVYHDKECVFLLHACRSYDRTNLFQSLEPLALDQPALAGKSSSSDGMGDRFQTKDFLRVPSESFVNYNIFQKLDFIDTEVTKLRDQIPFPNRVKTNPQSEPVLKKFEKIMVIKFIVNDEYRITMENYKFIDDLFTKLQA